MAMRGRTRFQSQGPVVGLGDFRFHNNKLPSFPSLVLPIVQQLSHRRSDSKSNSRRLRWLDLDHYVLTFSIRKPHVVAESRKKPNAMDRALKIFPEQLFKLAVPGVTCTS